MKNGDSFAEFGPNEAVVIDGAIEFRKGCPDGQNDFYYAIADVYVVPAEDDGPELIDVSGAPNTIIGLGGGAFVSEVIGFTAPAGTLGSGAYAIVIDECQNGVLDDGDFVLPLAFTVKVPINVPILPDVSILIAKDRAGLLKQRWEDAHLLYKWLFKLADWAHNEATKKDIAAKIKAFSEKLAGRLGGADIKAGALSSILAMSTHYGGIEADPPDLNFEQLVTLGLREPLDPESNDPVVITGVQAGETAGNEGAIAEALLLSIERYQGAALKGDGEWALVHAREIREYSILLAAQLTLTNAVLAETDAAISSDSRDLDGLAAYVEGIRQPIANNGFGPDELQLMENLGLSEEDQAEILTYILDDDVSGFSEATVQSFLADHQAENEAAALDFQQLAVAMDVVIVELEANAEVDDQAPVADAGGPYSGDQGSPIAFDGSGSGGPSAITGFEWDLDGDGDFDDATGATPSHTFSHDFNGLVGLRVTNQAGWSDVDYAAVNVSATNVRPVFHSFSPEALSADVEVGNPQEFSAVASDPDGDGVDLEWLLDGDPTFSGNPFNYTPSDGDEGLHFLEVVATDNSPFAASVRSNWSLAVFPPDADNDGWYLNIDCDDSDPEINPGMPEIVGNGIDDDCDDSTPDAGSPAVADFVTVPVIAGIGDQVQFFDTSTDVDGDIVSWSWDFGNDGSVDSTDQNPTNTYTTVGSFDVLLEVTDGQGHVTSTVKSVPVVDPSLLVEGPPTGTQYVSFWSGDLRVFAQRDNTQILLLDVDTGAPLSMSDGRISSKNFSTNPFTLSSAGDSFEGIGGLGNSAQEIRVRIIASDSTGGGEIKPVTVWTGALTSGRRHPSSPPTTQDPWMSYIPAFSATALSNGRELGREFLGFTTREMYVIAKKGGVPTSILVEDIATNADIDSDDTVTLTAASGSKTYEDAEIQVFFLDEFEDDTVRVTSNVDVSLLVGYRSAHLSDWTATPPSYAGGDDGKELGTLFYTFVNRSLTVFPTQDNTTVTITDLSDGDDSKTVFLANGDVVGGYDLYTPILDSRSDDNIIPRAASPAVTILSNSENPFDNDLVRVESDKPVLVYVGPVGSDVNEFADVAFSVPTGPESQLVYTYAQNFGASNDLQVFGFHPDTQVIITSLSYTDGFRNNGHHDFVIGPGIGGTNGWLEGTADGDVWWGSGVWNGEMLRIESTKPITVLNGDYDGAHFGAFIPFVQSTPLLPPVADAGADQQISIGEPVILEGSGSFDQDSIQIGFPLTYRWDLDTFKDSDGDGDPANDIDATGAQPVHTYAAFGTYSVQLTFTDDDAQSDTDETLVTVLPLPPVADAGGPYVTEEGGQVVLDGSASFDPDGDVVLYQWDLDEDGQFDDAVGSTAALFLEDDASFTVGLRVTDNDELTGESSALVTALNLDPVVNTGPDAEISAFFALPPAWFSDAGVLDTHTASIDWDDGTVDLGSVSQSPGSGTVHGSHTYTADGTYTVEVCVTDDDGGQGCDTVSVTAAVTNVSPQPESQGDIGHNFAEGEEHSHDFAFRDANVDDTHTATLDWGDGTAAEAPELLGVGGIGTTGGSHTYGDNGDYAVTFTVCDQNLACQSQEIVEHVTNLPPVVDAGPDQEVDGPASVLVAFTDAGLLDTHTASISWGDGSATEAGSLAQGSGSGTVTGFHTYTRSGEYTVEVCVTDDDGDSGCDTLVVTATVLAQFTISVEGEGTGAGAIDDDTISCSIAGGVSSGDCDKTLDEGAWIVLTASPEPGSAFLQWSGCDFVSESLGEVCHVELDSDLTVTATFLLIPDLSIEKADGGGPVVPGQSIVYELTFANPGPQEATGVVIMETVPDNTTFYTEASTEGWSCVDGSCSLYIGPLSGGAGGTVDFAVVVDDPIAAGVEQVHNSATIQDDGSIGEDPNPQDNTSSVSTPIEASPDLQIFKEADSDTVAPGAIVVYELMYANIGDQGATGVVLTEIVPDNTTFDLASSSAGWSCKDGSRAGTICSFSIGPLSGDAGGTVDFVVVADAPLDVSILQILNTSRIEDDATNGSDPNPSDNSDSEVTGIAVTEGRMTGGGSFFDADGVRYTHGFELHCGTVQGPNNLEINWGQGENFHMNKLTSVTCIRNGLEGSPAAGFDTYVGTGIGSRNGESGYAISFRFTDRGEPGKDTDEAEFSISGGPSVSPTSLFRGNHQAHPEDGGYSNPR